jgi:hypothetical protein
MPSTEGIAMPADVAPPAPAAPDAELREGARITINRFPYDRPNEVCPNAPEPTHRVLGPALGQPGYVRIFPLHREGRRGAESKLPVTDALVF